MESIDRLRKYVEKAPRTSIGMPSAISLLGMIRAVEQEHATLLHDAVCKAHADGERNALKQVRSASKDYRRGHDDGYLEAMGKVEGVYVWIVKMDDENRAFINPKLLRHHHEPTVEDVLRDYASRILIAGCIDEEDELVAEYATKLRLAGDE